MQNAELKADHKKWVREVFDRASFDYGKKGSAFFDYFGERLVELAAPSNGEHILDVGAGKGAVLFPAAKRVGAQGSAVGIDLSPRMIEEAAKKSQFPWVQLHQMDAEHLLFPDHSFDLVFCAFALFFFTDITQALAECRRVLKPSGRFAAAVFSKQALLDFWICEKVREFGVTAHFATAVANRVSTLQKHLAAMGFTHLETYEESKVFTHENAEEWWNSLWTHGLRSQLESLTPKDLEQLKREALLHAGSGKVSEERHVFYVIARF